MHIDWPKKIRKKEIKPLKVKQNEKTTKVKETESIT